jgi:hypothetical protein
MRGELLRRRTIIAASAAAAIAVAVGADATPGLAWGHHATAYQASKQAFARLNP